MGELSLSELAALIPNFVGLVIALWIARQYRLDDKAEKAEMRKREDRLIEECIKQSILARGFKLVEQDKEMSQPQQSGDKLAES